MRNLCREELLLIENHHQAYYAWKKYRFSHQTLIHIDAHLDYEEADHERINIGNFIFFAIKRKTVAKIYWVIPGTNKSFYEDIIFLKQILVKIQKSFSQNRTTFSDGLIKTSINAVPLYISTLSSLPNIQEPVLLDIDVDFFMFNRLKNNNPLNNIGKRKPWITTDRFTRIIQKKIIKRNYTTIAYSVNGGYTPMTYKTLGDELANKLGFSDTNYIKKLQAGRNYIKFRKLITQYKIGEAKKYYQLALFLNGKYLVKDNNYGPLFLLKGDLKNAEKEFSLILRVNPSDINCLAGLGIINIYKNDLVKSRTYFKHVLDIKSTNKIALLYLVFIELKLKNYSMAKKYFNCIRKYYKKGINKIFKLFILAKLYGIENKNNHMEKSYQTILKSKITGDLFIPTGLELLF